MKHTAKIFRAAAALLAICLLLGLAACRDVPGGEVTDSGDAVSTCEPLFELKLSEYRIIYPEKASAACKSAAVELKRQLEAVCGGSIGIEDDWTNDPSVLDSDLPEILIGTTNRTASAAASAALEGRTGWTVRSEGKRIVVSASGDALLSYAVSALAAAVTPAGDGVAGLPQELSLECDSFITLTIASGGVSEYPIVYSRHANADLKAAFEALKTTIDGLLGSDKQGFRSDALSKAGSYDSTTTEILIGDTDYSESAEGISRFGGAEYGFTVVGKKLIVGGRTPVTTVLAVGKLCEMLKASAVKGEDGKVSLLLPCPDVARFENADYRTDIPAVSGLMLSRAVDTGDNGLMLCYDDAKRDAYTAYCAAAEEYGFVRLCENTIGDNTYSTYEKNDSDTRLYVAYAADSLRITTEPADVELYLGESGEATGSITFTQMALSYTAEHTNGMGYVLRLADGSFVIWDGGFTADAAKLNSYLQSKAPAGEKPHVRLWILTHMHGDHIQCFQEFSEKYASEITLDYVGISMPDKYCDPEGECTVYTNGGIKSCVSSFAGAKLAKLHEGDVIKLAGAKIEVLGTYSLVSRHGLLSEARNDTSVVTRLRCGDKTILLLGDAQIPAGEALISEYGTALASTYVQIAHHGSIKWPTTKALYEIVKPQYAFFPGSTSRYKGNKTTPENKYVIDLVGARNVYVADGKNFELTLG
ncbi:MAG: MBL fold metallo-hydrolase [Clostridiales bacterium]|nr:MBL fold metallo-hydrolase [Clostridiales bacterium]